MRNVHDAAYCDRGSRGKSVSFVCLRLRAVQKQLDESRSSLFLMETVGGPRLIVFDGGPGPLTARSGLGGNLLVVLHSMRPSPKYLPLVVVVGLLICECAALLYY